MGGGGGEEPPHPPQSTAIALKASSLGAELRHPRDIRCHSRDAAEVARLCSDDMFQETDRKPPTTGSPLSSLTQGSWCVGRGQTPVQAPVSRAGVARSREPQSTVGLAALPRRHERWGQRAAPTAAEQRDTVGGP